MLAQPTAREIGGIRTTERLHAVRLISAFGGLCLAMVMVASAGRVHSRWGAYRDADAELAGLRTAAAILELIQATAEHHALTAGLHADDAGFRNHEHIARDAMQQRLVVALVLSGAWSTRPIHALRASLAMEVPNLSRSPAAVERNAAPIERECELLDEITGSSGLSLDADPLAHSLIVASMQRQLRLSGLFVRLLEPQLTVRVRGAARAALRAAIVGVLLLGISGWLMAFSVRWLRCALAARDEACDRAARTSAFLATVLEAAPESIVIVDASHRIEMMSAQVEATFGYMRVELLGRAADLLFPPAVLRRASTSTEAADRAKAHALTVDCQRRSGATFPAEIMTSPVQIGEATYLVVVARDLSARRAMEHQLQQSQRMEAIGQLTGGLAHDFNNLLGVIVGNLDLLERHVRLDAHAIARVATAQRAAMRGSDLTRRLLAFARCQHLNPQPTLVNRLISELLEILPRTLGPDIEITTSLAPDLPAATVDAPALESALLNLALNARDAMPDGGKISITTTAVRRPGGGEAHDPAALSEDHVRITVSDTGHGMSAATVARAFEPFFTTKPRGKGTGLGLAMVYGFVRQSRGHLHVDSQVGVGTTFTIDLPVAEHAAVASSPPPTAARPFADPGHDSPTVLVVDDEPDLREIAATYCQELGLRVLQASDGMTALELAVQQPRLDLLLTDLLMPGGLSGIALAACLRPQYPALRVVYCSGFAANALADHRALRVDGPLIQKPYLKDALLHVITEALEGLPQPAPPRPQPGVEDEPTSDHACVSPPADRR